MANLFYFGDLGPKTYEFKAFFGTVSFGCGWATFILDKSRIELKFGSEIFQEAIHQLVTLTNLNPDPEDIKEAAKCGFTKEQVCNYKLFHKPEKTSLILEDETETHITLHYKWKPETIDLRFIPDPGCIRLGP